MDTQSLRLFVRIAALGSITAAARDLSLSPASASARLSKLEDRLGTRLFRRTTREVALTTDGADFLPYAQDALEVLQAGMASVSGQTERAHGLLRMTMPGSFGRMYIIPALDQFQARYPEVRLDLRLSDEVLDVVKGAFDLIIRNAPLEDSGMIARQLASDRRLLVASPAYLERFGSPTSPADLTAHRTITFPGEPVWRFAHGDSVRVDAYTTVNDGEAMRQLLEGGAGIGIKSLWNACASLNAGRLVPVLEDYPLVTRSAIWAVHPSGRVVAPKVRAMINFLSALFSPQPPWEQSFMQGQ
ncbi:LysR family transcriptional regulator [Oceanococcus atlanticus]|uniref:LysR family transcriptional regulator n=1 Tax=Oceanococcus atlanticus TaxID=1317117 RepID=A0A1Y1SDW1_9GAMM|nr:LysR family transcriptional regulator [Oceanococcus atlanticus]ORE87111.1 LysR family transcriptional regulator [Oceanococcus atlanticus]RZO86855.1 MAG: LysR family transcriptional regulator [Oceanococcus sp.]